MGATLTPARSLPTKKSSPPSTKRKRATMAALEMADFIVPDGDGFETDTSFKDRERFFSDGEEPNESDGHVDVVKSRVVKATYRTLEEDHYELMSTEAESAFDSDDSTDSLMNTLRRKEKMKQKRAQRRDPSGSSRATESTKSTTETKSAKKRRLRKRQPVMYQVDHGEEENDAEQSFIDTPARNKRHHATNLALRTPRQVSRVRASNVHMPSYRQDVYGPDNNNDDDVEVEKKPSIGVSPLSVLSPGFDIGECNGDELDGSLQETKIKQEIKITSTSAKSVPAIVKSLKRHSPERSYEPATNSLETGFSLMSSTETTASDHATNDESNSKCNMM